MSRRQHGFSLLELLVVLFVVVIITSLVTLTVNTGTQDRALDTEVRNLADVAAYAIDEAQFSGRDYGLLLQRRFEDGREYVSYSWRERRPEGWREPTVAADIFVERQFEPTVELELFLDDLAVPDFSDDAAGLDATPQVIFYSSGETTPGALEWRDRDSGNVIWRIEWDLIGRFTLLPFGEPLPELDDAA